MIVIQQDPVMFSGNVRDNLDPFGEHSDEKVINALRRAAMYDVVAAMPHGLRAEVRSCWILHR